MIRVFELFFKCNFKKISAMDFFAKSMVNINIYDHECPICHTKHPHWKKHEDYERYLVSYEDGQIKVYKVTITRYKCSSCGHTHAILPESIIPYQSYSFLFILEVLSKYFTKSLTVEKICDKYAISVSTLYAWKRLFIRHKKIWLGLLKDAEISTIHFLDYLNEYYLYQLNEFFLITGISFMQGTSHFRKARSVPV